VYSRPGLFLSAYNAAPAIHGWNPVDEAAYLTAAASLPHIGGLEVPFYATGKLHKYDGDWFLRHVRHLPLDLGYIVTTIPDTMDQLSRSPAFGLASVVPAGRQAALARAAAAAEAVRTLNQVLGRKAVRAVHLFSAPRPALKHSGPYSGPDACVEALADSLKQLAQHDWDGARPILEHCDAATGHNPPVKGFLPLEQEIDAVLTADMGAGVAVNWARSVIESRDTNTPDRHVELALHAEVLAGVVLSGCASQPTAFGRAWEDAHLPPAPLEPTSLLTPQGIRDITATLDKATTTKSPHVYRGLKISAPPTCGVEQRLSLLAKSILTVRRAGF
jgi:hypothetical protein